MGPCPKQVGHYISVQDRQVIEQFLPAVPSFHSECAAACARSARARVRTVAGSERNKPLVFLAFVFFLRTNMLAQHRFGESGSEEQ